ncbi:MAG: patatin-like phospholipase family protein [Desulfatiglans sp.]|nr:patatin-like phospholipase family protein [Thermodesulfobacteriota bacterium]MEE4351649.1 patatin-like phospholipase family protein [Desulfatiglans sp.]
MSRLAAGQRAIGVAFSSGFFGFFAHAGFLAALREFGISPVAYSGASSGAIVAAMAASGMTDAAIKKMLFTISKEAFWDPVPRPFLVRKALRLFRGFSGYLRGDAFAALLEELPVRRLQDCAVPLAIAVTDLVQKEGVILREGNLPKAIQASGAVPILFQPVEMDGSLFVDGGISNKAPVKALTDLTELESIIVHFISSQNLMEKGDAFLKRRMTPWHIHYLTYNIVREEAYKRQLENVRRQGIEVIEIRNKTLSIGPNTLDLGPAAYTSVRDSTMKTLKRLQGPESELVLSKIPPA